MIDVSIAIVLILATAVAAGLQRAGVPATLGFLLSGALAGPYALALIRNTADIHALAELGLIFLLFMVGLELSPAKLKKMRETALGAGMLYLTFGALLIGGAGLTLGLPPVFAFFIGATLALSSTALVVKTLEDTGQNATPVGLIGLGTLIVQDIAIIPLLLLLPLVTMASQSSADFSWVTLGADVSRAFGVLALMVVLSFLIIPRVVDKLAATRSRELFTLSVFSLGLGMAFLAKKLGLSMEVGAFVGGLALSGSVYSRQVLSDSRPFRDVFAALFFVSLGAFFNPGWMWENWALALGVFAGISVLKILAGAIAIRISGLPWKTVVIATLYLFQVGELSYIIMQALMAEGTGILNAEQFQVLVHAIVLGMFLTPLLANALMHPQAKRWLSRLDAVDHRELARVSLAHKATPDDACDEALIVGYGPIAQRVAEYLQQHHRPYHVIEINPATVKNLLAQGVSVLYGDARSPEVLKNAHIEAVKLLVVTVPDLEINREIIHAARCLNEEVQILARARFASHIDPLKQAGASEVIYDEAESAKKFLRVTAVKTGVDAKV